MRSVVGQLINFACEVVVGLMGFLLIRLKRISQACARVFCRECLPLLSAFVCFSALVSGCAEKRHEPLPHVARSASFLRPTEPGSGSPRFDPSDVVETIENDDFKVHYSVQGPNAVPLNDGDASGVPDFAELVLRVYDEALTHYTDVLSFQPPIGDGFLPGDVGGDAKFDIYLVDFAGRGDGQYRIDGCRVDAPQKCAGHMLQENDFAGYGYASIENAIRIVGSHELFHAVQAAYASVQDVVVSEATAVWATERFDPSLNDFESFVGRYLSRPDRSLYIAPAGIVDSYPYSVSLFFRFLDESVDPQVVLRLWERLEQQPTEDWVSALDSVLNDRFLTSFSDSFERFAIWNVYTAGRANPAYGYAEGDRYPLVASEVISLPHQEDQPRLFSASARYWLFDPGGRSAVTASVVASPETDSDGVSVWMVPVGTGGAEESVDVTAGAEVPMSGVQSVVVTVINRNPSGASKRPALCFGTSEETEDCAKSSSMDGGVDDGGADAGVSPDAGSAGNEEPGGCSSHRVPRNQPSWPLLAMCVVVVAAVRRRATA